MFAEPVSEEDAPGYADMIERPMDLGTITAGITKRLHIIVALKSSTLIPSVRAERAAQQAREGVCGASVRRRCSRLR